MTSVLVIGAGPAGLAAAGALQRERISFDLVDRTGQPGGAYAQLNPNLILASPARHINLPGFALNPTGEFVTALEYRAYLRDYAHHFGITLQKGEVDKVRQTHGQFQVSFRENNSLGKEYRAVVVASGCFDHPRWPDIPGLPTTSHTEETALPVLHSCQWLGPKQFEGKRLLIIGGAISAVEIAEECTRAGIEVMVSSSRGRVRAIFPNLFGRHVLDFFVWVERLPRWVFRPWCQQGLRTPGFDQGFRDFCRQGLIAVYGRIERIREGTAVFLDGREKGVDAVVCATGYLHEAPFLEDDVARAPDGHPATRRGESINCPGLYFIGFPCARGVDSQFLRGMARDAPKLARRIRQQLARQ